MSDKKIILRISPEVCPSATFSAFLSDAGLNPFFADSPQQAINFVAGLIKAPSLVSVDIAMWDQNGDEFLDLATVIQHMIKIKFGVPAPVAILTHRCLRKDEIKRLQFVGVSGVMPRASVFGMQATRDAYTDLLGNKEHWPKFCIDQPAKKAKETSALAGESIQLTDRQQEVQRLLCERGLSNKGIARQLNISESTVKIHVSAILKRYGVRNRTQLALAVNNGARL